MLGQKRKSRLISVILSLVVGVVFTQINTSAKEYQARADMTSFRRAEFVESLKSIKEFDTVKTTKVPVYAKSYLLFDSETAQVIIGKNYHDSLPVASTTKMTTALLSTQFFKNDDVVTVSAFPTRIAGSKIALRPGEKITVGNLLKGLLIYSGNDTAFALAEHYSGETGDYMKFVDEMNKFAKKNHLMNTTYGDPAGLDDDTGRSSSFDLTQIARMLLNNSYLSSVVAMPQDTITSTDGAVLHQLKNTNRLIEPDSVYYLPDVVGIKTGFTPNAGHCLISARKIKDRYLIGVVLNTDEFSNTASASEMKKLFNWADNNWQIEKY